MEELLKIEELADRITKESVGILERNYPMDSREFLTGKDAKTVLENDDKIKELADMYLDTYRSLTDEEKRKVNYKNLSGIYYQATHKGKGLVGVSSFSDEYELHDAFARATSFGMEALDGIFRAEKANDQAGLERNQRILDTCKSIMSMHFWGNSCLEKLQRYDKRIRSGRTIEEDIADYANLINEARELQLQYAKAKINGIDEEVNDEFIQKFEDIFARETSLIEFIPRDILMEIKVNLHWLKIDAQRTPQKVIDEYDKGVGLVQKHD